MTQGGQRKEDKRAVFTAPILRLKQEGDVCPIRDLERSGVRVNEGTRVLGDRGPRNWRWRVENTLAGRPQLEADKDGDEVERCPSPRLGHCILGYRDPCYRRQRWTVEQVEKDAHYPIKPSCQCKERMRRKNFGETWELVQF